MQLWGDDIEAMRAEARDVVAAGFSVITAYLPTPAADLPDEERLRQLRAAMAMTYTHDADAEEREIAGVRCKVFLPPPGREPRALYLHFHGGGMILGAPEMNDLGNRDLADRLGLAVVSVDYRLAPEHPYPAGLDDCVGVLRWALEHGERDLGASRILLGGESAGGYLTMAVLLRARDELGAIDRIAGANAVFGVFDWGRSPSQRGMRPHPGPDMLDPDGIRFFGECYLPGRTDDDRRDPAVSPAFADLHGLPPVLLSVGTCDHLLDDSLLLAGRLAAVQNRVELFVAPDMPHGFMAFPCGVTTRWAERTTTWFTDVLARTA